MRDLKDTVAWITGAGTGIGEGAAVAMAREGAKVILTGRRLDPLEQVSKKINISHYSFYLISNHRRLPKYEEIKDWTLKDFNFNLNKDVQVLVL